MLIQPITCPLPRSSVIPNIFIGQRSHAYLISCNENFEQKPNFQPLFEAYRPFATHNYITHYAPRAFSVVGGKRQVNLLKLNTTAAGYAFYLLYTTCTPLLLEVSWIMYSDRAVNCRGRL